MRLIDGTNLVFAHVPKTGGQSVMAAFGLDPDPGGRGTAHLVDRAERRRFVRPEFVRFCTVRDPVARFVSAYRYHLWMISEGRSNDKPVRLMIAEHGLDGDVNALVAHLRETGFDLQSDLHFRRQVNFLRPARVQILLRQETLETDIRIVAALAPRLFRGLPRINVSDDRDAARGARLALDAGSLDYLEAFYALDIRLLGYPRRRRGAGPARPRAAPGG